MICDRQIPSSVNGKVSKTVVYDLEIEPLTKRQEITARAKNIKVCSGSEEEGQDQRLLYWRDSSSWTFWWKSQREEIALVWPFAEERLLGEEC